jgi:hypothetical protein
MASKCHRFTHHFRWINRSKTTIKNIRSAVAVRRQFQSRFCSKLHPWDRCSIYGYVDRYSLSHGWKKKRYPIMCACNVRPNQINERLIPTFKRTIGRQGNSQGGRIKWLRLAASIEDNRRWQVTEWAGCVCPLSGLFFVPLASSFKSTLHHTGVVRAAACRTARPLLLTLNLFANRKRIDQWLASVVTVDSTVMGWDSHRWSRTI